MGQEKQSTGEPRKQTLGKGAGRRWWKLMLSTFLFIVWFLALNTECLFLTKLFGLLPTYFYAAKVYSANINIKQIWNLLSVNFISRSWSVSISAFFHDWTEQKRYQGVCEQLQQSSSLQIGSLKNTQHFEGNFSDHNVRIAAVCLWARHKQNKKEDLSGDKCSEAAAKNSAFFFFSLSVVDGMKSNMLQLEQGRFRLDSQ